MLLDNATFNFLGITWRVKHPGEFKFQAFTEPKIQNLPSSGYNCAASKIYWLHYKTVIFSYSGVGTYEPCKTKYVELL